LLTTIEFFLSCPSLGESFEELDSNSKDASR